ncbi:MAG: hypothetical protein WA615_21340, partial [Bradyrhizobium sp.]
LSPNDVVYTSGAPDMTESVARIARAAGARCYADPCVSSGTPVEQATLMTRLAGWLNDDPRNNDKILQRAQKPTQAISQPRVATVSNRH